MSQTIDLPEDGYAFVKGVFQYSAGVGALPGHRIVRVRFFNPVPLDEGFARIKAYLTGLGRPLTAFCACELRSPAPFTEAGFMAFNRIYAGTLQAWGIFRDGENPVARSNVCPELNKPAVPSFHAFSYVEPAAGAPASFVIAGSGEAMEGSGTYAEKTVRYQDISADAIAEKARFVLGAMERRMAALGRSWADTTGVQVYSVHDIHPFLAGEIVGRGAGRNGVTWHYCRPPVVDLEYEMDCRGVAAELVI